MRILFLTHAFNSLAQRLWVELTRDGHDVSVEFDINDAATRQAVALWRPDLVIAPFLKRAIPADVTRATRCLIVHPGPLGDRGPSALDWAVQEGRSDWGVTVLEAVPEMDAGPVWAHRSFALRAAPKSSLYRREVTEEGVAAVREALDRIAAGRGPLRPVNTGTEGTKPAITQAMRALDWAAMTAKDIVARIRAADGQPGVRDALAGQTVWLHDAHPAPDHHGAPGALIGAAGEGILRACRNGAVWIGALKLILPDSGARLKLPARAGLDMLGHPPLPEAAFAAPGGVATESHGPVALIRFPFQNGAIHPARARALTQAIRAAADGPARVILLTGGAEFWSNGIDLATIESSDSPAEASMAAIEAMDDLCLAMLGTRDKWVIAAMRGNAGAGGVFLALAADEVLARDGVVLNPHYRNMGNLYGSEYWTYLLPKRLGAEGAVQLMANRMPLGAREACAMGLIDGLLPGDPETAEKAALAHALELAADPALANRISARDAARAADWAEKPLAAYRAEELARMRLNFFGFDTSYHVARFDFITATPKSRTPLWLARHRRTAA